MTLPFESRIDAALCERQRLGLYRKINTITRDQQFLEHNGSTYLNFSSNDYLGLAQSKVVCEAWLHGVSRYGCGSAGSPLVTGHHSPHRDLIDQLTEWLGYESAVLFNSGYSANQAVLLALLDKNDVVLQDKLNHASLLEAGLLSPAIQRRFAHNDSNALSRLLAHYETHQKLVVTEGVFSMDGDLSPLRELRQQATSHAAWLMVDDAHGCGVLGDDGRGSCDQAKIQTDILVITFGKAFGLQGAAVLCRSSIAEYLTQCARHWIYSTAMPPAQAVALSAACRLVQTDAWRREKLFALSEQFHSQLSHMDEVKTASAIKPVIIGDSQQAVDCAVKLKQRGFWVTPIRPPTVPKGTARLRVTLTALHTEANITALTQAIQEVMDV